MISSRFLLLSVLYGASLVAADSNFIYPVELDDAGTWDATKNEIVAVGTFFNIAWTTSEEIVTLIINQNESPTTEIDYLPNSRRSP